MASGITSGDWRVSDRVPGVVAVGERLYPVVARVTRPLGEGLALNNGVTAAEADANARLIAAAPELLRLVLSYSAAVRYGQPRAELVTLCADADALLGKIGGQS